jgi:hypothetical protein
MPTTPNPKTHLLGNEEQIDFTLQMNNGEITDFPREYITCWQSWILLAL